MAYLEVNTEDNLQYQFYPAPTGSVEVKVRAPHDAHIALTTSPQHQEPLIEIIIGGWTNTRSVLRKNKVDVSQADTENILDPTNDRTFWIKWDCGRISIGKEGEAIPFLSYIDPEPFPIGSVGVCTGHGATGSWQIDERDKFNTPDKLEYQYFPVLTGSLELEYRGKHNCHVCLAGAPADAAPIYEVILGGWENKRSVIRRNRETPDKVVVETDGLLTPEEYRRFVLSWHGGRLEVIGPDGQLMEWTHSDPFAVTHFGVRSGYGATGLWRIKHFPTNVNR